MRERETSLPCASRTTISDSTARWRVAVGKLWPAPRLVMRTTTASPSIDASYAYARRTCVSLRDAGKRCERTIRGGSPTATGRSTIGMWQSRHTLPALLPCSARDHWSGVPAMRWQLAHASTSPTRPSNATVLLEVGPALHRRHADAGLEHRPRRVAAHAVLAPEAARREARLAVEERAPVGVLAVLGVDRGMAARAEHAGHHLVVVRARDVVGGGGRGLDAPLGRAATREHGDDGRDDQEREQRE